MIPARVRRVRKGMLHGAAAAVLVLTGIAAPAVTGSAEEAAAPASGCQLGTGKDQIRHVVYMQFDNVHFTRDVPNVPSDLEQMPHLLNFFTSTGSLLTQHHTPLIAHTGTNFVSSLTGVYPDRHGANVSNGFRYFNADGSSSASTMFAYWIDRVVQFTGNPPDPTFNMLTADGHNAPAPWVPYTRAGCNVGFVGMANAVLENTGADCHHGLRRGLTASPGSGCQPGPGGRRLRRHWRPLRRGRRVVLDRQRRRARCAAR